MSQVLESQLEGRFGGDAINHLAGRVEAAGRASVATVRQVENLELTQLSRGRTMTQRVIVPLGGVWLISARAALPLVVRGRAPSSRTTLIVVDPSSPFARLGLQPIHADCCGILHPGATVDLFLPEGCRCFAVSIPHRSERLPQFDADGDRLQPPQHLVVHAAWEGVARLLRWSKWIAANAATNRRIWASGDLKRRLQRALTDAARRIIADAKSIHDDDAVPLRQRAVMRARDLVRERLSQPISLVDMCGIAQVRARTLEYGFRELYGMSPIAYVRCERLCRVRDDLLGADRGATSIRQTASRWGFVHMSQFAKDYRTLFGESPSTTLLAHSSTGAMHWLSLERPRPQSAVCVHAR
jgi:AraC family ethanolamine operon transcriptional activator